MISLINYTKQDPTIRPLKGVLYTMISNWILKSREDFDNKNFYKYMTDENSLKAMGNHQIWMQKVEYLNDQNEGRVFEQIFNENNWLEYNWARNLNVKNVDRKYVCSFTKRIANSEMIEEYGSNMFGYKSDRIIDLLSPAYIHPKLGLFIEQTSFYDVTYSVKEFKDEIQILCRLIEGFEISDKKKHDILVNILPYWRYSIKSVVLV